MACSTLQAESAAEEEADSKGKEVLELTAKIAELSRELQAKSKEAEDAEGALFFNDK